MCHLFCKINAQCLLQFDIEVVSIKCCVVYVCQFYGYSVKIKRTEECWAQGTFAFLCSNVFVVCFVCVCNCCSG